MKFFKCTVAFLIILDVILLVSDTFSEDRALHSIPTLALQFPWTLKFLHQHRKDMQNIFIIFSIDDLMTNFGCASFRTKPRISTQRAHIRKLSLIQFYDPSTIIPLLHVLKIYSHIYSSDFCLHKLAKLLSYLVIYCTSSWPILIISLKAGLASSLDIVPKAHR